MNKEEFDVLMLAIVSDFLKKIMKDKNCDINQAMEILYNSKLYRMLEDEKTKLWQYSSYRLLGLLNQEINNGFIEFADV